MSNREIYSGPIFFTILGLMFVLLKLANFIDWPWVWVLSPFWIPFAFLIVTLVLIILILIIAAWIKK